MQVSDYTKKRKKQRQRRHEPYDDTQAPAAAVLQDAEGPSFDLQRYTIKCYDCGLWLSGLNNDTKWAQRGGEEQAVCANDWAVGCVGPNYVLPKLENYEDCPPSPVF